jgi:glycosyltransferase involved in cell wall biosynthesis
MLIPGKLEGIGWFIFETTRRMVEDHPEDTFILVFDRKPPEDFLEAPNVVKAWTPPQARHPILFKIWFDFALPRIIRKHKADIFVSCDGFASRRLRIPTYLIIHDLAYLHYPDFIPNRQLRYYQKNIPDFVKIADGLGTVSDASRRDLAEAFELDTGSIDLIYNGCRPVFKPLSEDQKKEVAEVWGVRRPYFIYAGAVHPRKNVVNVIRAYNHFRLRCKFDHSLVIAGRKAWMIDLFDKEVVRSPFNKQIHQTGYVDDESLARLMASSSGLIYPSLFEGFGVPVLEAMNAEVPVVTSDVSSLPEVAGNAALLIDPENPQDIGGAMYKLANSPELSKELVGKGKRQRKRFSWDKSAAKLYKSILRTHGQAKTAK